MILRGWWGLRRARGGLGIHAVHALNLPASREPVGLSIVALFDLIRPHQTMQEGQGQDFTRLEGKAVRAV